VISSIVFITGSIAIAWVSRASLRHPRSHGFPRFFAFEAILALIIINATHWFGAPFSLQQVVSWLFLVLSILFVVSGFVLLRRSGKSFSPSRESTMFEWENTAILVKTGIYRYIRHPMYSSLLFLAWGALLKSVTTGTLTLAGIATLAVFVAAKAEEAENIDRFGHTYRDYMRQTRRFVPFLL
jgi:protein-S-isoprenylcysteine O-methyltransferase Ste14